MARIELYPVYCQKCKKYLADVSEAAEVICSCGKINKGKDADEMARWEKEQLKNERRKSGNKQKNGRGSVNALL